jgi:diguanylate cyclase (GGDEF)-like protein/PAS domain S-box-containing protein
MSVSLENDEAHGRPESLNNEDPYLTCMWGARRVDGRWQDFYCTPAIENITGYRASLIYERDPFQSFDGLWFQMIHDEDRRAYRAAWARIERGSALQFEHRIVTADQRVRWIRSQAAAFERDGELQVCGTFTDITAHRCAEETLRQREEHFRALIENASDIITILGRDGTIRYESPSVERILGYKPEDLVGTRAFDYVHPGDLPEVMSAFIKGVATPGMVISLEFRFWHKDGTWRIIEAVASNMLDVPSIAGIVINSRDITARKMAEERLMHDAFHDGLTGLPNRALFRDRLGQTMRRARRRKDHLFAVLFLDLDRFKVINDSMGHMMGDDLLVAIARRLKTCTRPGDTIARLGGDEFTILLDDIEDEQEASLVADRIHEELSLPFNLDGQRVYVTASIGIALGADGYRKPEELLRDADTAMYRAKMLGKARHVVFDKAMHARAVAQLQLESDLWQVIERNQLVLHYQPMVELGSGRVIGLEALVRWNHPQRGLIMPAQFIPLAEETRLIAQVGRWVLKEACRQMRSWQKRLATAFPISVSVNLSGKQLAQPDLIEQVEQVLKETGLDPEWLKLEITESVVMENAKATVAMLGRLRALGLELHIDDFGTGYSSLSYLHRFPVDRLKIDRSFVSNMSMEDKNSEIVRTIIQLARNLGMGVVAEGVQTAEQLAHLKALGCEHGQGYFFSRPLAADQVDSLIGEGLSNKRSASTETGLWPRPEPGERGLYDTGSRMEAD